MYNFLNVAPDSFLPHPPESDTVQLQEDHRCYSKSRALHIAAVKYG